MPGGGGFPPAAGAAAVDGGDLTQLSLEQLMDIPVVGASKYAQKASEAPADVSAEQRPAQHDSKLHETSVATINRELAVLSHLLNKAVEWGWIDRRPAKINRFREQNARITYLTVGHMERLLECAKGDGTRRSIRSS